LETEFIDAMSLRMEKKGWGGRLLLFPTRSLERSLILRKKKGLLTERGFGSSGGEDAEGREREKLQRKREKKNKD